MTPTRVASVAWLLVLLGACQRTAIPPPAPKAPARPLSPRPSAVVAPPPAGAAARDVEPRPADRQGGAAPPAAATAPAPGLDAGAAGVPATGGAPAAGGDAPADAGSATLAGPAERGPKDDGEPVTAPPDGGNLLHGGDAKSIREGPAEADEARVGQRPDPRERILLLAPDGPLIVDVRLRFHGESIDSALERLVDEAFRTADEDGDGHAAWRDVAEHPRFASGEFGNLSADTDEERRQLIRIYDTDNDGEVDRGELPRFLTRNVGGGRSFSLRSSNEFRTTNRRRSPTRLLLDQDHDGVIDDGEMRVAPRVLGLRDSDEDGVVLLAEIREGSADVLPAPPTMSSRRRVAEPDTAVWLTDKSVDVGKRWGVVEFQLRELYAFGDPVSAADWPYDPGLFQRLDTDRDERLSAPELPGLLEGPAHLELLVEFDRADAAGSGARLELQRASAELTALRPKIQALPTHLTLQLPRLKLSFFVNEDATLTNVGEAVRGQFTALDRDRNGYLEAGEVPAPPQAGIDAPFAALDADRDGKVYEPELLAYVRQRTLVTRAQVRGRAADQEDALFAALDADNDGRLSGREQRRATEQLHSFDRDGDGRVTSDEIPGSMVLAFVRGNPQQDERLFAGPVRAMPPIPVEGMRWFRGMDANGDGEISAREFYGTPDQFQRLDADHDGFVSVPEAAAVTTPRDAPESPTDNSSLQGSADP